MIGQIRNIFPGGNTSAGFYSYYRYILPQENAERIFCIKGGPGVGKSTLMKNICSYFAKKGEDVDLFRCSSDPDSLDGILLKERQIAIVDGTSPHVIDPANPGAVDEIVDLGQYLDEKALYKKRNDIMKCSSEISDMFDAAYVYLKCAGIEYKHMARLVGDVRVKDSNDLTMQLDELQKKQSDESNNEGSVRRFFAGAITSGGIKSCISSLAKNIDKVFAIDVPAGAGTSNLLRQASAKLRTWGFAVEEFYCPMEPGSKLEHIVSQEAGIAVFSINEYHGNMLSSKRSDIIKITPELHEMTQQEKKIYEELKESSRLNIEKAIAALKQAKALHDELESFYIPAMDFDKIEAVKHEIINKIESRPFA